MFFVFQDQEGGGNSAISGLNASILSGSVNVSTIDMSLRRLMRVRIGLGMLDPPTFNKWNALNKSIVESQTHLEYARQVARQSICLFKNDDETLPIDARSAQTGFIRLALIGPQHYDADLLLGNYAVQPASPGVVSIFSGIFHAVQPNNVCGEPIENYDYYQPGEMGITMWNVKDCANLCSIVDSCAFYTFYDNACYLKNNSSGGMFSPGRISGSCHHQPFIAFSTGCVDVNCPDDALFPQALKTAQSATHIILTLGLNQDMESEGHDRADINLPYYQYQLLAELKAQLTADQQIICLLIHGGTFSLKNVLTDCDAIVDAWYPSVTRGKHRCKQQTITQMAAWNQ